MGELFNVVYGTFQVTAGYFARAEFTIDIRVV